MPAADIFTLDVLAKLPAGRRALFILGMLGFLDVAGT